MPYRIAKSYSHQMSKITHIYKLISFEIDFCHRPNFSAIVYIAVRIHVMFDYMNHNMNPMLLFMFILNIPNLQRLKLDYFMFHVMFCDKHNMNLAVLIFLKTYVCKHESKNEK